MINDCSGEVVVVSEEEEASSELSDGVGVLEQLSTTEVEDERKG